MQVISASKDQIKRYKDLVVWQKSVELAVVVYEVVKVFPKNQQYSLVNQIERSAVSIASNIAEGAGRNGKKEFCHYLSIAMGSLYELETQLVISQKIGFLDQEKLENIINKAEEIGRMLAGLKRSLES